MEKAQKNKVSQPTRRDVLYSAAAAGAGLLLSPMISVGQEASEPIDDINVAIIGVGAQGQALMHSCRNIPGLRFKAVCDIWADFNRKRAARIFQAYGHEVNQYEDYKQMLVDERDLDAVIIATPDFWHAEQTVACLQAGLHVYCEKEMSNTIEGAKKMVQAAKQSGKLLQTGRQRRSNPRYLHCYEKLIKQYDLFGQFVAVNGQWNRRIIEPYGWPEKTLISQDTLEKYGYDSMHQFRNWNWFKGLGNGLITGLGSHQIDVYNWFLDAVPKSVTAAGITNFYDKHSFEWPDSVMAIYEYETVQGTVSAFYQAITGNSNESYYEKFLGDEGMLKVSENGRDYIFPEIRNTELKKWFDCTKNGDLTGPAEIMQEINELTAREFNLIFFVDETPDRIMLEASGLEAPPVRNRPSLRIPVTMAGKSYHQPHLENFFDAIRGKTKLNCSAEVGFKTAVTVLKINEAIETGNRIQFTPADFMV